MPKIRYLRLRFANALAPHELPCFRAAVIERTERASAAFHNHRDPEGYYYRYPLIQYKIDHGRAAIVCIDDGADEIHHLLQQRDLTLRIGERTEAFTIEDVRLHYVQVQTWQTTFRYRLLNWIALNQENYPRYMALDSEIDRLQLLERILTGNLLAFAKSIGWRVEERLSTRITRLHDRRFLPYKGQDVLTFSLEFTTNVSLPDYVGIGKGSSVGFGVVWRSRKSEAGSRKNGPDATAEGEPVEENGATASSAND